MHGEMRYMENYFDKRLDPRLLVDGAKSVISLGLNYYNDTLQLDPSAPKISKYAYGADYHTVIKDKLKQLLAIINEKIGEVGGRAFVDSAPVLDKAWAKKAGMGWIGKNSNLISKKVGSFFFLAELIIDHGTGIRYRTHCRPLRHLHKMYRCMPYGCHCRPLRG
jgi:epoxyqueuosine reductase